MYVTLFSIILVIGLLLLLLPINIYRRLRNAKSRINTAFFCC